MLGFTYGWFMRSYQVMYNQVILLDKGGLVGKVPTSSTLLKISAKLLEIFSILTAGALSYPIP